MARAFSDQIESPLSPSSLRGAKRRGNPEPQTQAFPGDSLASHSLLAKAGGLPRLRLAMTMEGLCFSQNKKRSKPQSAASASLNSRPSVKGQERAALILDAAQAILIEEGYGAFSTRKIAERLGMRLSNVQYYYASRSNIMQALLARSLQQSKAAMQACVRNGDLDDAVTFVLNDQLSMRSCRLFWELWALSARDRDAAKAMNDFYRAYQRLVGALIAMLRPDLKKSEIASRATVITGLLEGISLFRGHGRAGKAGRALLDREVLRAVRLIATA